MHILITDDESYIREGIKRTIESVFPNYHVHLASSAEEAVLMMSQHRIDIILTDILMPGINGLELMRISRHSQPQAKWIVISAHSEFSYAQQALHLGARDYLLKPIGKKKLVELMESLTIEIRQERVVSKGEEALKDGLNYLREAVFQRLAAGLSMGKISLDTFIADYPEFHLILVKMEQDERSTHLEHFIVENVLNELIDQSGQGFVVSFDRNSLLGLVALHAHVQIEHLLEPLQEHLHKYLKVPFSTRHSGPHHEIEHVAVEVNRLREEKIQQIDAPEEGSSSDQAIQVALQYIRAHFNEELSLEKVAAVVFLNPIYFSQLFKQKTGQGYKDYVICLRMEQAKVLLHNPKLKLADIAEQIGYTNVGHFTQVFRKKFMVTPTEYRMQEKILNT